MAISRKESQADENYLANWRALLDEVHRRYDLQVGQQRTGLSRAGVLVASAAIAAGLLSREAASPLAVVAICFGSLAALSGAISSVTHTQLWPPSLPEIAGDVETVQEAPYTAFLVGTYTSAINRMRSANRIRQLFLALGYAALALEVILLAALAVLQIRR